MNSGNKPGASLLKLSSVSKAFDSSGSQLVVLNDLSLEIQEGEFISIQGASGIGKSTLLYIMGLLDNPSQGNVYFRSNDITGLSDRKLSVIRNKEIGFIFQFHHLLPDFTAWENIILPCKIKGKVTRESEQYAKDIINIVGMEHRLNHLPSELSGGERQRVALARSLVNKPSLLLADEPSGNLDTENTVILHSMLKEVYHNLNTTIVLVTHDNDLAAITHKKYLMQDGRIDLL